MTSTKLRWLTYLNPEGTEAERIQNLAKMKIEGIQKRVDPDVPALWMRILLYINPTRKRNLSDVERNNIKQLILCGGTDVRYLSTREDQRLRISIQGNKLYLAMSDRQDFKVHEGFLYVSESANSPLIQYYKSVFNERFEKAKKLKVRKNGRIACADNWVIQIVKWINVDRAIAIISVITAILFGILK